MTHNPWLRSPYRWSMCRRRRRNLLKRHSMLWMVLHRWAKTSKFAFNYYHHEVRLVVQRPGKEATFLLSLEGVTQEDSWQ